MKLLIDIPEHIYEHAKAMTEDSRDEGVAMRAIANGSPARCKGMDEAEKERLIKKDIRSIENRVRSAFNQGYEMGLKESRSEIPNTCGDAISREKVYEMLRRWFESDDAERTIWRLDEIPSITPQPCEDAISRDKTIVQLSHLLSDWDDDWNVGIRKCIETVKSVKSVTPQQRTGRWIIKDGKEQGYDIAGVKTWYIQIMCEKCGFIKTAIEGHIGEYKFCPKCGAKMIEPQESEE